MIRRTAAIIAAGGTGERFGVPAGKQMACVAGLPVLSWSVLALDAAARVDEVVVVAHPERLDVYRSEAIDRLEIETPVRIVPGGASRQDSVRAGLDVIDDGVEFVVVHDGARPLVPHRLFDETVGLLEERPDVDGVVVGYPSVDTLKRVSGTRVVDTPERSQFWAVQTPQTFRADSLRAAHARAFATGFQGTDDASLVEAAGGVVVVMSGPRSNVKITHPEDIEYAEWLLMRAVDDGSGS